VAEGRERLRYTFDQAAQLYAQARPGYPEDLFDDLERCGRLTGSTRVLEVGCGTGQATRSLARRGWHVTAVELGGALADVARRELHAFRNVEVVTAEFERWEPPAVPYQLVFAATSWHWLDPDVAFDKAAGLLGSAGSSASSAPTTCGRPAGTASSSRSRRRTPPSAKGTHRFAHRDRTRSSTTWPLRSRRAAVFSDPVVQRYLVSHTYTAEEYIRLLNTYSGHIAMSADQRAYLFAEIRRRVGDRSPPLVRKHYLNVLHVSRVGR
jgi:SAM-dependent methyltransferase